MARPAPPAARPRALKRADLVERLAAALGAPDKQDKVGFYYHEMEQGLLPSEGVNDKVLEALGTILGQSAEALRQAGRSLLPEPARLLRGRPRRSHGRRLPTRTTRMPWERHPLTTTHPQTPARRARRDRSPLPRRLSVSGPLPHPTVPPCDHSTTPSLFSVTCFAPETLPRHSPGAGAAV